MKKKMVIRVHMNGDESRSKAMQIVVGINGVTSAAIAEKDKSQLEVIGEGVDPVKLTTSLRKKLAKWPHCTCLLPKNRVYAELISVTEVKEEKKPEPKKEEPKPQNPIVCCQNPPPFIFQEVYRDPEPFFCSIL